MDKNLTNKISLKKSSSLNKKFNNLFTDEFQLNLIQKNKLDLFQLNSKMNKNKYLFKNKFVFNVLIYYKGIAM